MSSARPAPKAPPGKTQPSGASCDLCGLPLRGSGCESRWGERTYAFCCIGCRQVFSILLQAAGTADPEAFRRSELFRQCQANGIIPRSAEEPGTESPLPPPPRADAAAAPEGLLLHLKVENLWCPACAWLIETVLGRTPGVNSASCSFVTDHLLVRYDPAATAPDRIRPS
jgi:copper chaperone CopZ